MTSLLRTQAPPEAMAPIASSSWPGHSQLADDEDIERRLECPGHFKGHRHAATRQGQHQHVRAAGVLDQPRGESSAGLGTISESF